MIQPSVDLRNGTCSQPLQNSDLAIRIHYLSWPPVNHFIHHDHHGKPSQMLPLKCWKNAQLLQVVNLITCMNMNVFQRSRAFFHGVRRDVHVPTKSRGVSTQSWRWLRPNESSCPCAAPSLELPLRMPGRWQVGWPMQDLLRVQTLTNKWMVQE